MAIFPDLVLEQVIQVSDKLRLDASNSFVSKDEADITEIEIDPDGSTGFISVYDASDSSNWFLDWAYASAGSKTVTVRVTTDGAPVELAKTITALTEAEDGLLSTDQDLMALEHDILEYLPAGKNSFKYLHRKSRDLILDYLDKIGMTDLSGNRLTKSALVETEEYRTWSKYMTLKLIFDDLSNAVDDVFYRKAQDYSALEENARSRVRLPVDLNGDGAVDDSENLDFQVIRLVRD